MMRSRHITMTEAEFALLPHEIGWNYVYADGKAHIQPQHLVMKLTVPVQPRLVISSGCWIRPVRMEDSEGLVRAFTDGFRDAVEYCDCTLPEVRWAGQEAISTFFAGRRGAFHAASCLVVPEERSRRILGAALVVQKPDGPFLDMLFIRRRWQQQGLATALAATVMNALHQAGERRLGSAYNLANLPSMAWHHKFGFCEDPDLFLCRVQAQAARHELWRREQIGGLSDPERADLEAEITRWDRQGSLLAEAAFGTSRAAKAR